MKLSRTNEVNKFQIDSKQLYIIVNGLDNEFAYEMYSYSMRIGHSPHHNIVWTWLPLSASPSVTASCHINYCKSNIDAILKLIG